MIVKRPMQDLDWPGCDYNGGVALIAMTPQLQSLRSCCGWETEARRSLAPSFCWWWHGDEAISLEISKDLYLDSTIQQTKYQKEKWWMVKYLPSACYGGSWTNSWIKSDQSTIMQHREFVTETEREEFRRMMGTRNFLFHIRYTRYNSGSDNTCCRYELLLKLSLVVDIVSHHQYGFSLSRWLPLAEAALFWFQKPLTWLGQLLQRFLFSFLPSLDSLPLWAPADIFCSGILVRSPSSAQIGKQFLELNEVSIYIQDSTSSLGGLDVLDSSCFPWVSVNCEFKCRIYETRDETPGRTLSSIRTSEWRAGNWRYMVV